MFRGEGALKRFHQRSSYLVSDALHPQKVEPRIEEERQKTQESEKEVLLVVLLGLAVGKSYSPHVGERKASRSERYDDQ